MRVLEDSLNDLLRKILNCRKLLPLQEGWMQFLGYGHEGVRKENDVEEAEALMWEGHGITINSSGTWGN